MICTAAVTGCEKVTLPYEDGTAGTETGKDNETGDNTGTEEHPKRYLTVAEAIEADDGEEIWVRGFVVGSTEKSMANAIFAPPFEGKSAWIIADRRLAIGDSFYDDELFPVYFKKSNMYQAAFNLVDNPGYWSQEVVIYGIKGQYLRQSGMTEVFGVTFFD